MVITDDSTTTLRANMKHHEPIVLVYDARGNGGGRHSTDHHRRPSEPNYRLHSNSGGDR